MRKKARIYSDEDRLSLLRLYYASGLSKYAFCKQHNLYSSLFNNWIRRYPIPEKVVNLPSDQELSEMANRSKDDYKNENAQLKKRIKSLEKALSFSKLEAEARDLMITRAEEYFNVPIRKKSGAK
ncbi:transposase [Bacteroides sp. OttesenSCG-928-E20]|nr:transposase [Bacteroides sp. OttesenSCG-928-N06]MDL2299340.1 transposase [Bacteroides sp. OttesenSCG-928-E20]MDL2304678.1 transposase [Bacteroides sp. OttesenSCG-928-D19]